MPTDLLRRRSRRATVAPEPVQALPVAGRRMLLRCGGIEIIAVLADTATADRVWAALPLFGAAEPWGQSIHFELPIASGRDRTARIEARMGDIYFWPREQRILIPFGPTPISRPGEMRMPEPLNVFARAVDDVALLRGVRVGERVSLLRVED